MRAHFLARTRANCACTEASVRSFVYIHQLEKWWFSFGLEKLLLVLFKMDYYCCIL